MAWVCVTSGCHWVIRFCLDLLPHSARWFLRFITIFIPTEGKTTFNDLLTTSWGRIVLIGVVLCLIGIYICGKAGVLKERELSEEKKKESVKEFNLVKGLVVCIVSGILSACFNYGIEAGSAMAETANQIWKAAHPTETINFLYRNNVTYIVLLWGGLTTNLVWCMILNSRNKTFHDYTNTKGQPCKQLFFCSIGRYYLVPAILFLWNGRK